MPKYIIHDNQVHFRQSFPRDVLAGLFVTLYALGVPVNDTGSRIYPHSVTMSESEFLSVIELSKGA
jgi:hypothetical protein